MYRQQEIIKFINAAFESSIYHDPRDPGLSYDETLEICRRAGYEAGESADALSKVTTQYFGGSANRRLLPDRQSLFHLGMFSVPQKPDHRNLQAFDFIQAELGALVRSEGIGRACISRDVLAERAVAKNIPRQDIEAAMTLWVKTGHLIEKDGVLRFAPGRESHPLPSQQLNQAAPHFQHVMRDEIRAKAHSIVADQVGRRADGRPQSPEPFEAFAEHLEQLGYRPFRLWWTQTVAELLRSDQNSSPLSVTVLSAALVEGVLAFVVKHARTLNLGVFASSDFDKEPRTWKIENLIASAATGKDSSVLDDATRQRALRLTQTRQRIHAGRMLSEFPQGVPDLKPDESRDAKATAEQVVRSVLNWLERFPSTASSS